MNQGNSAVLRVRVHLALAVAACAVLALLAAPALASAASYVVNGTGDTDTQSNCENPGPSLECTLRGAIEASNGHSHAAADLITFDNTAFTGSYPGGEITLGSPLSITEPTVIEAGRCTTIYGEKQPCAEIRGATGQNDFVLEAADSTIEGLAITGGANGIVVGPAADDLRVSDDWFGLRLEGGFSGAIAGVGVSIGPGAEGAVIGGELPTERNVFLRSMVGVEIRGASHDQVKGNYIGLFPNGTSSPGTAPGTGVKIVDTSTSKAEHDEVGGVRSAGTKCGGACNVISTGQGVGVDLGGGPSNIAATGPTTIRGNFFGLAPAGTAQIDGSNDEGVYAGPPQGAPTPGPGSVTIGGESAGEHNYFVGGVVGVHGWRAEHLVVRDNAFGYGTDGEAIEDSPPQESIQLDSEGLAEGALVEGNRINAESFTGIGSFYAGSTIVDNQIAGGAPAIYTEEESEGVPNAITLNQLTAPDTFGIEIENDSNVVAGNTITKAAEVAIYVGSEANHNRIGGDESGEANSILETVGTGARDGAIVISSRQTGRTEVAANTGSGNSGAFIKLFSHGGPEEPNGGVKAPTISGALQSSAAGTADPNATVRVFSKASPEPGELGPLIAVVKADATGHWSATYSSLSAGTLVTATQTREAGTPEGATSELATAVAAAADPNTGGGGGGGSSQASSSSTPSAAAPIAAPAPTKPKAPTVKITKGPKKTSEATKVIFKFAATPAAGAKFECKLDGAKWAACRSPKTYKGLKPGKRTFRVRAKANGLTGPVTKYQFTITG